MWKFETRPTLQDKETAPDEANLIRWHDEICSMAHARREVRFASRMTARLLGKRRFRSVPQSPSVPDRLRRRAMKEVALIRIDQCRATQRNPYRIVKSLNFAVFFSQLFG
jgi:hypothetical protein